MLDHVKFLMNREVETNIVHEKNLVYQVFKTDYFKY